MRCTQIAKSITSLDLKYVERALGDLEVRRHSGVRVALVRIFDSEHCEHIAVLHASGHQVLGQAVEETHHGVHGVPVQPERIGNEHAVLVENMLPERDLSSQHLCLNKFA